MNATPSSSAAGTAPTPGDGDDFDAPAAGVEGTDPLCGLDDGPDDALDPATDDLESEPMHRAITPLVVVLALTTCERATTVPSEPAVPTPARAHAEDGHLQGDAAAMLVGAWAIGLARHVDGMSFILSVTWIGGIIFPFLVQLTLLSLFAHAVTQHKVAGHITLIVGWVLAVAMERSLALPALVRFGNLPPYTWTAGNGFGGAARTMAWFVVYWSAVGIVLAHGAACAWVRGHPASRASRMQEAFRRLQRGGAASLLAAFALAALAAYRATH